MPPRLSPFYVPKKVADEALEEIVVRAEAKQRKTARRFNPLLGSTAEEADEAIARMQRDINAYGEYVYGHKPAPVHRFWNQAVDDVINRRVRQNKILLLAPPNSAKSTWNSLIRTTHYLGQHPDQHLIFLTSSDDMSKTFASTVRMTLSESEKHAEVFSDPEARPHKVRGWSGDGLYLRGTPVGDKDPAYKAVGWGMTIMGARANGILLDDVLDQKTAESEAEQRKAISYYDKTIVPRLNTHHGWIVAAMTRYAEGDLAGHIIKLAEEVGDWIVIRTPLEAEEHDPMGRLPGESLWPEQFPPEFIEATKKRLSIAEYQLVYNCLDGESRVGLTSSLRRLYRRWYEGPRIEVVTASGKKFAGTPNHPVLTPQGWVPLGQLVEGGDVVCSPRVDVLGAGRQDIDHSYPQVREIFDAAAIEGEVKLGTTTEVDFHGDVRTGQPEVEIVDIDGSLMDRLITQFPQIIGQPLLGCSDRDLTVFARLGSRQQLRPRLRPSVDPGMRRANADHVGVRTLVLDAPESGVTVSPDGYTSLLQLEFDRGAGYAVAFADSQSGLTPQVTTDKIVQIVRDPAWSGHVYNLETDDHRYITDEVIVHNCDPVGLGGDIFTSEGYFKDLPENFWTEIEPTCYVMQAVDLAFSKSKQSCFTVIMTVLVDPQFRMYVLHIDREHYQIRDSEERIKELIRLTKPVYTAIETENFHDQFIRGMVLRIMNETMANVVLEKPVADKITRARLPAGRAEHGMLFVDHSAPWFRAFMGEVLGFPHRKLKDQVDALSLAALTVQKMEEDAARYTRRARRRPQVEHVLSAAG